MYSEIIEKTRKQCKEIKINSLIALCEIKDYDSFCEELESLIESKRNKDLIYKMVCIMQGKLTIGYKKYKEFVKKYQDTIEIMKKYHCLSDMTIVKYNSNGKPNADSTENYFYKYISEHKDDMDTIKSVAIKIKNLGFDKILYGKNLDFTDTEYELDTSYDIYFEYLENMEAIPTYDKNPIQYRTSGSCYRMTISTNGCGSNQNISRYGRVIELNSLIFDPNRLPNELTKESTIEAIVKLADERKDEYKHIRDSLDMSISIDDLIAQYNHTKAIIEKIDDLKNKDELVQILHNILEKIMELWLVSLNFENEIIASSEKIDEDRIETEKKLYLKRRSLASIDD